MAELKRVEEYHEDYYVEPQPKLAEITKIEPVLTFPSKKSRNISVIEKVIIGAVVVCLLGLAVMTIKFTTTISRAEQEIMKIERNVALKQTEVTKLEQEKRELSDSERIKKAAEKAGMTVKDENIRNVKK